MFNGQFRLHENLMYEKKFAKVNFAESLQWPIYNCLLCNKKCNKKIVGYYNYLKHDHKTARTTAHPNCCRRACMYDCTPVCKHNHACSECLLLQVFKNAFIVGRLGSGLVDEFSGESSNLLIHFWTLSIGSPVSKSCKIEISA